MSIPQNENMDKYLELATIDDLVKKYSQDGYSVSRGVQIGDAVCDLLLEKGGKKVYIEVAVRGSEHVSQDRNNIVHLHKAIKALDSEADFRTVFVGRPRQVNVEIEHIEKILMGHLLIEMPSDLASLAPQVSIERVDNVEIDDIYIKENHIHVTGSFSIDVTVQYDSNLGIQSDREATAEESFPATFGATLNGELDVDEIHFTVDVSSWYEGEQ